MGRLTSGTLYRLIPNWRSHWDYEHGHAKEKAFRKDGDDGGVSMLQAERITIAQIQHILNGLGQADFGICRFDASEVLNPPPLPPHVYKPKKRDLYIEPRPEPPWGDAHFVLMGATGSVHEWLYRLAKTGIEKPPGQWTEEVPRDEFRK